MKVLQLGPYPPPHGGVQTHVVALVEFLRKRGVDCEVVNLTRFRRPSENGIFYPPDSVAVLWHLLSHRYDIIHLHIGGRIWPRQLALALTCCSLPNSKCVFTFHSGGYPSSPEGRSANAHTLRGFVLRRFDQVIAVNSEIAQFFQRIGIRAERIRVISPFVEPVGDANAQDSLPTHLSEFFASHHPVLISVGLLEPEYDLTLQMEALGSVRKRYPKAGLLIVGSGSIDKPLQKQAGNLPYSEHILLTGDLEHAATLQAIQRSDLMLRTTWYDGDALSVREALHLGVPVIATDNGMRPKDVRLVPARSLDALLGAIEPMLAAPAPTSIVSSGDHDLEQLLSVYEQLASAKRR